MEEIYDLKIEREKEIGNPSKQVVGIVPCHGHNITDYEFPWHSSFLQLKPNWTALQQAIEECAVMGVYSIWVVMLSRSIPLAKRIIGEYVYDGVKHKDYMNVRNRNIIPIFYIPVSEKHLDRYDCLVDSAFYGCEISDAVARKISGYIRPEKFFISWPYGVMPIDEIQSARINFKTKNDKNIIYKCGEKSVRNGDYLPIVITMREIYRLRRKMKLISTTNRDKFGRVLPKDMKYSYRFLTIKDVFDDFAEDADEYHISEYHDVSTWEGYRQLLIANPDYVGVKHEKFLKPRKIFGRIGYFEH